MRCERRPHISRIERSRRLRRDRNQQGAWSDERKRLLRQCWRDSCAMGKAIFGSSGVTKGYAFSPQFGHFPGFAFSACGSFAADYGTTEVRPMGQLKFVRTSLESRNFLLSRRLSCAQSRLTGPTRYACKACINRHQSASADAVGFVQSVESEFPTDGIRWDSDVLRQRLRSGPSWHMAFVLDQPAGFHRHPAKREAEEGHLSFA